MHPTGQSMDVIRQVECLCQCFPAGDAWRWVASFYLRRLAPESVVITEGERVDGQGRVEFFLGSKLIINALVSRNGDLCVDCCEALEHYYGWGKKDNRRRQRQLESLTPQPNKSLKGTRD